MAEIRTYRRSTAGWWMKNPFYARYMAREVSSFFLFAFALVVLYGLWRLSQGPTAFEAWRASLATPVALLFSLVAFLFALVHTVTWFEVMPKTMPKTGLPDRTVTAAGLAASAVASVILLALAIWWGSGS